MVRQVTPIESCKCFLQVAFELGRATPKYSVLYWFAASSSAVPVPVLYVPTIFDFDNACLTIVVFNACLTM